MLVDNPSTSWQAMATSSHEPMALERTRIIYICFRIQYNPSRRLWMRFFAGYTIADVKLIFAQRAQDSGHRHHVAADPAAIDLYFNGEMLQDGAKLYEADLWHGCTVTLHP